MCIKVCCCFIVFQCQGQPNELIYIETEFVALKYTIYFMKIILLFAHIFSYKGVFAMEILIIPSAYESFCFIQMYSDHFLLFGLISAWSTGHAWGTMW